MGSMLISSSNFTIPIEDLRLDKDHVDAYKQMHCAKNEFDLNEAVLKMHVAATNAENHAILEINLDNRLLEQNCEIIIHSKYMPHSQFEKLTQNTIPIYLYGITGNQLNRQVKHIEIPDEKKLRKLHLNTRYFSF